MDAAIIMLTVAPTDAKSRKISAPFNSFASIKYLLFFLVIVAPKASKPFKCKSMGRETNVANHLENTFQLF